MRKFIQKSSCPLKMLEIEKGQGIIKQWCMMGVKECGHVGTGMSKTWKKMLTSFMIGCKAEALPNQLG